MEHYKPNPETRAKLDSILEEHAKDCANTHEIDITSEAKKALHERWKTRLRKMREIDRRYCEQAMFKIYD